MQTQTRPLKAGIGAGESKAQSVAASNDQAVADFGHKSDTTISQLNIQNC